MTPKYEQLVQRLRAALPQWYADGQRKLPGEQALAAQLSVSRQTLRQALAVLEQEGLIEKRRGSGSFLCPAAARQDRRIAVIATLLSDYIFPSLLKDVQACLSAQGFSVVIHATENSIRRERDILQQLLLDPPAGLLVEGCKTGVVGGWVWGDLWLFSSFGPVSITSAGHEPHAMGRAAAENLLTQIRRQPCQSVKLPWTLYQRQSG